MNRIEALYSDLSRLGRETEMMDTVITMLADDLLETTTAEGHSRQVVISRVVDGGFELAELIGAKLNLPASDDDKADDVRARYRRCHLAFTAAAAQLAKLPEDTVFDYRGLQLTPGDIVPQRIGEIVIAHDSLGTAWTIEEADPDSALDALETLIRRLKIAEAAPALVVDSTEGDHWEIGDNGQAISGDREDLVQWLAWGYPGELESDRELPTLPTLPRWT
ncbi:mycothiol-dependent maleylpyruvate isomerase [Brevibacterium aurantiacum]|uniref:Mycothiol-dependent maleylpyruvate isomerase n=1 Tax=Brevibacterium aurantiacum TaxID=273384 RepID=A0A556CC00_BREAU|nr:mycothiol-dependent maleylpyruvate isomerase [Brevibacterium aurantiacum]TSI14977.1 mycothiol-dependent maleylpyruvate isomerase [Brevibacterium aurantiacum]